MCSNYRPLDSERILQHFGAAPIQFSFDKETYPGKLAPILRPPYEERDSDRLECVPACFGLVPHWADLKLARKTYNSRTETTGSKPSFKSAWRKRQFCIIPADAFYEPCYETGRPVRWKIQHATGRPLGIAGIWEWRPDGGPENAPLISFSMLTINADHHELMRRFHAPDDEKRMVVILEPRDYHAWLHASVDEAPAVFKPYPAEQLVAEPAPKPPATKKTKLPKAA